MKLKEFFYLLGGTPEPRSYGFTVDSFSLFPHGVVEYAQWLHPRETKKVVSSDMVKELSKFLSPGDAAIDIGAHSGDSTIPIALSVGKSGCVLALEPNPYVFPVLKKNSELNPDKTNIIPLMFAATPEDGEFEFEYSDAGYCNGGRHLGISKWRHGHLFKLTVQGKNLQSFLSKNFANLMNKIRFIKVDTEGFDLQVLEGLSELIAMQKPYIKAEVFKRSLPGQRRNLLNFFKRRGYNVHRVESDSHYTGEQINDENVVKWRHFDIFCVPTESPTW